MMALVLAVPLMGQQAYATGGGLSGTIQNFFEWSVATGNQVENGFWKAIYGDSWNEGQLPEEDAPWFGASRDELTEKLDTYNETLKEDTGTDILGAKDDSDGTVAREYVRRYFEYKFQPWELSNDGNYTDITIATNAGGLRPIAEGIFDIKSEVATGWAQLNLPSSSVLATFVPPESGKMRIDVNTVASGDAIYKRIVPSGFGADGAWVTAIVGNSYGPGSVGWRWRQESVLDGLMGTTVNCQAEVYIDYAPTDGIGELTKLNVTEESRAGSIEGTTTTSSGITYYDYSVVNNNTYTSPLTGEQKPISEWQYDYVERQYNLVCEDGSEVKVVYGDENMTVQEGDTIETVYYGDSNGSDSGGDSEGGFGQIIADSLAKIGEFIGGLIAGILSIVASAVESLDGLLDIFNGLIDTIKGFFGGFTDFLANLFPFLPEETFQILNFGLILFIASAVIRKMFF